MAMDSRFLAIIFQALAPPPISFLREKSRLELPLCRRQRTYLAPACIQRTEHTEMNCQTLFSRSDSANNCKCHTLLYFLTPGTWQIHQARLRRSL